jgi:hypothetical protein
LRAWYDKYENRGFTIVGVHSPEFFWEKPRNKVKAAVDQLGVRYPVVQDNGFEIWKRYGIWAWPTTILVDKKGIIFGTGMSGKEPMKKPKRISTSSWQKETLSQSSGRDRA